jgi:outer membrane protein assembly factor BamB
MPSITAADDWPQWLGPQRDGGWREEGILVRFPPSGPTVRWRVPAGAGYAGPAVAGNRVYLTDYVAKGGAKLPPSGFTRGRFPGVERVRCLDDATGKVVWTHEYDCTYTISYPAGPRATPLVAGGKVYTLGAMGDLRCLDADTGRLVWSRNLPDEYNPGAALPIWGYAAHPLLDGDRLITLAGGDGRVVVALHKDTGTEIWRSLSSASIGYCPPVIYTVGMTRQLIIWHPEAVCGLDPETGKRYWEVPFPLHQSAMSISMPRFDGHDRLFITSFYNSALTLKLDRAKPVAAVLWKGKGKGEKPTQTDTLHSIMPTPITRGGYIYGVDSYGELRCLKADTGERVWTTMAATRALKNGKPDESKQTEKDRWGNAFLTPQADRCFLFNEHGDLIIAKLSPAGYEEIDRARLLEADNQMPGRLVVWSHPAYAHHSVYARNDHEIVRVSLGKE